MALHDHMKSQACERARLRAAQKYATATPRSSFRTSSKNHPRPTRPGRNAMTVLPCLTQHVEDAGVTHVKQLGRVLPCGNLPGPDRFQEPRLHRQRTGLALVGG